MKKYLKLFAIIVICAGILCFAMSAYAASCPGSASANKSASNQAKAITNGRACESTGIVDNEIRAKAGAKIRDYPGAYEYTSYNSTPNVSIDSTYVNQYFTVPTDDVVLTAYNQYYAKCFDCGKTISGTASG